jgi:very-short-patch-repair endonuclease
MLPYDSRLKSLGRKLRNEMTDSARKLWSRVRRKQLLGVSFYRQKPIGKYIVDFYAPKAALVIEVDGSQHFMEVCQFKDNERDQYFLPPFFKWGGSDLNTHRVKITHSETR